MAHETSAAKKSTNVWNKITENTEFFLRNVNLKRFLFVQTV